MKSTCLTAALLLSGAGCGPASSVPPDAVDATVDSAPGAAKDTTAETASDTPTTDALSDAAQADTQAAGADSWCGTFATALCASAKGCCSGAPPSNCEATWKKACAKAGFDDLDDALIAGKVTLADADKSACIKELHAAASGCDKQAVGRALANCLRGWRDPASVGNPCAAPVDLPCAQGKGRCSAFTPDLYVCVQPATAGQACSATVPCAVGLECLDGALTRAKTCGAPGSTCNLADKCWDGWTCDNGNCKKQDKGVPAACADDAVCPGTHQCSGATCVAKLCL